VLNVRNRDANWAAGGQNQPLGHQASVPPKRTFTKRLTLTALTRRVLLSSSLEPSA
jgi:hypothetical protein